MEEIFITWNDAGNLKKFTFYFIEMTVYNQKKIEK